MKRRPIGFFDSGVGGISVLKEAVKLLPNEEYIYFGDSKNAPYGTKIKDEVKELSFRAVEFLMEKNAKAIVIACNTATSAAIEELRVKYSTIPIIGIEPALKPAVELKEGGNIVIMATPMTLAEAKFNRLVKKHEDIASINPLPCSGLVEFIERGIISGEELNGYLRRRLEVYKNIKISSIVLGCTHYPFIKEELRKIVGEKIAIIDGSEGTVKQLKRQLHEKNLLNDSKEKGNVKIYNSSEDNNLIKISKKLLTL
ncbi:glutamate racemase [Clostridium sediminicola]|uniref:glutamate racemase n=1 Tax=Clostridium sediminicola TaxID=3114879 RepID=UPI003D185F66